MKNVIAFAGLVSLAAACSSPSPAPSGSDAGGTTPGGNVTADDLALARGCPASTGPGTDHASTLSADETWSPSGNPHRVPNNLSIEATLTLDPCTVVLVGKQVTISVGNSPKAGRIVAKGAVDVAADGTVSARPVTFDAADAASPWAQLFVSATGTAELSVVALKNSGDIVVGEAGALRVGGMAGGTNLGEVTKSTKLDRVLVEASRSFGINFDAWGTATDDSAKVWVRGSGSDKYPYPIRLEPGIAGTLPKELTTSGNKREAVLMSTSKTFMRDDTLRNIGIPYRARGALYVNSGVDGKTTTLTIEPGVTVAFEKEAGSGIYIGTSSARQGVLVAAGTAEAPITFTSANETKAAGDWMSLYFKNTPTSGNKISHAKIEYAGGESGTSGFGCGPQDANNDSAIFIQGQGTDEAGPESVFVDNTSFDHTAGATVIVSGWYGDGPNFATGNTFGSATPACKVSQPRSKQPGDYCANRRGICWN
jgi:hypothetical protein